MEHRSTVRTLVIALILTLVPMAVAQSRKALSATQHRGATTRQPAPPAIDLKLEQPRYQRARPWPATPQITDVRYNVEIVGNIAFIKVDAGFSAMVDGEAARLTGSAAVRATIPAGYIIENVEVARIGDFEIVALDKATRNAVMGISKQPRGEGHGACGERGLS